MPLTKTESCTAAAPSSAVATQSITATTNLTVDRKSSDHEKLSELKTTDISSLHQLRNKAIEEIINLFPHNNVQLVKSVLNLADLYFDRNNLHNTSFVKIAGLINFAINVLRKKNNKALVSNVSILKVSAIFNLLNFISYINKKAIFDDLMRQDLINLTFLNEIRRYLSTKFKLSSCDNKSMTSIYDQCFDDMKKFFISLIEQSMKILGQAPCSYSFAFSGSNSRRQATLYSDVEFFIIVDQDDPITMRYFQNLTLLILLKIVNLGETILPAFGIHGHGNGTKLDLTNSIYDQATPRGYAFDPNIFQASKTPLGKKVNGKLIYRLIGTPGKLARYASLPGYQHDRYLPQIMRLSQFAYGSEELYAKYLFALRDVQKFNSRSYGLALLMHDIDKYTVILHEIAKATIVRHEKHYYRPVNILIDSLFMLLSPDANMSSYQKILVLEQHGILNRKQGKSLDHILSQALYLRFQQHTFFRKHHTNLASELVMESQRYILDMFGFFKKKVIMHETNLLKMDNHLYEAVCLTAIKNYHHMLK